MSKEFQEGEGEFDFPNGDTYKGYYGAHRSGLAWRVGRGVYITKDGQTYEGNWIADKLNEAEAVCITFQSNDQYNGRIKKYKYNGNGAYTFANRGILNSEFVNNKPVGNVIFIDTHNELWYGEAEAEHTILTKEHAFSYELDSERGKGRPKQQDSKEVTESLENIKLSPSYTMKEWEEIVFCKSFKTPNDIDFSESEWFNEYKKFSKLSKKILHKIKTLGLSSLTAEENEWHENCLKSAKILQQHKHKPLPEPNCNQLEQYFEEKMQDTCPAHIIFCPHTCNE